LGLGSFLPQSIGCQKNQGWQNIGSPAKTLCGQKRALLASSRSGLEGRFGLMIIANPIQTGGLHQVGVLQKWSNR
jgi:hypothetical protein